MFKKLYDMFSSGEWWKSKKEEPTTMYREDGPMRIFNAFSDCTHKNSNAGAYSFYSAMIQNVLNHVEDEFNNFEGFDETNIGKTVFKEEQLDFGVTRATIEYSFKTWRRYPNAEPESILVDTTVVIEPDMLDPRDCVDILFRHKYKTNYDAWASRFEVSNGKLKFAFAYIKDRQVIGGEQ